MKFISLIAFLFANGIFAQHVHEHNQIKFATNIKTPPDSILKKWGFTGAFPLEFYNQDALDAKLSMYYGGKPLPQIDFNRYHLSGENICMQCFISCDHPQCHRNACMYQFAWLLIDQHTWDYEEMAEKDIDMWLNHLGDSVHSITDTIVKCSANDIYFYGETMGKSSDEVLNSFKVDSGRLFWNTTLKNGTGNIPKKFRYVVRVKNPGKGTRIVRTNVLE